MGIEPTSSAWKAEVLPLNYTRDSDLRPQRPDFSKTHKALSLKYLFLIPDLCHLKSVPCPLLLVEGGGFEPPKAEPSDLQSDPFGHSGTPPKSKPRIVMKGRPDVNGKSTTNC